MKVKIIGIISPILKLSKRTINKQTNVIKENLKFVIDSFDNLLK